MEGRLIDGYGYAKKPEDIEKVLELSNVPYGCFFEVTMGVGFGELGDARCKTFLGFYNGRRNDQKYIFLTNSTHDSNFHGFKTNWSGGIVWNEEIVEVSLNNILALRRLEIDYHLHKKL